MVTGVITCTRLKQIPGGGFYPTRGAYQEFSADPTDPGFRAGLNFHSFFSGESMLEKKTKLIDDQWGVTRVEASIEMPSEMFAFEFPKGTLCLDMDTGQQHLVGAPDEALKRPVVSTANSEPEAPPLFEQYYGKRPELTITDARGTAKNVKLSDFRGKWVLIEFWGLSCGPCITALPELAKFYERRATDRSRIRDPGGLQ